MNLNRTVISLFQPIALDGILFLRDSKGLKQKEDCHLYVTILFENQYFKSLTFSWNGSVITRYSRINPTV
jgi:hypothetical protein